jgi:hypothetical protein
MLIALPAKLIWYVPWPLTPSIRIDPPIDAMLPSLPPVEVVRSSGKGEDESVHS